MSSGAHDFVWYELVTNGVEEAAEFYRKVVGWDLHDSGMPGVKYTLFGKGGKDVGGMMDWHGAGGGSGKAMWMGHIYTPDVDAEVKAVQADGGTIKRPPMDIPNVGRFAVVTDPQGATFLLFQPGSGEAPPRLGQNDLGNVGWHELATTDWEKAWEFYSKHFGWTKDFAMPMGDMGTYQLFNACPSKPVGAMMNTPPMVPDKTPAWQYYFTVEDADKAVDAIKNNGGTVVNGPMDVPGGSKILHAIDPQGASFALMTPQTEEVKQP